MRYMFGSEVNVTLVKTYCVKSVGSALATATHKPTREAKIYIEKVERLQRSARCCSLVALPSYTMANFSFARSLFRQGTTPGVDNLFYTLKR